MMRRVRGFLLPTALFALVILAALGAYLLNIFAGQSAGLALDVRSERAYQAAYAGREWARYQVSALAGCPADTTWGASGYSLDFGGTEVLGEFRATVECRLLESTNVAGVATAVLEVRITACSPAQGAAPHCPGAAATPEYVERQVQAIFSL